MKKLIIRLLGGYTNDDVIEEMKKENRLATIEAFRDVRRSMELLYDEDDALWRHNAWTYVSNNIDKLEGRL